MQVLRYEKPERNVAGMECIDLKHTDTINTICFVSGTTDGWWGKSVVFSYGENSSQGEKKYHCKAKEKSSGNRNEMELVEWKECSFCCGVLRRMHELKVK